MEIYHITEPNLTRPDQTAASFFTGSGSALSGSVQYSLIWWFGKAVRFGNSRHLHYFYCRSISKSHHKFEFRLEPTPVSRNQSSHTRLLKPPHISSDSLDRVSLLSSLRNICVALKQNVTQMLCSILVLGQPDSQLRSLNPSDRHN